MAVRDQNSITPRNALEFTRWLIDEPEKAGDLGMKIIGAGGVLVVLALIASALKK